MSRCSTIWFIGESRPEGGTVVDGKASNGALVVEGDEGGITYLVCSLSEVKCSQTALRQLVGDLDALMWLEAHEPGDFFEDRWSVEVSV